jgi:sugar (pentulose or hexulose) kinase
VSPGGTDIRPASTDPDDVRRAISAGSCVLGIELGSTRIKAVLIDGAHTPVAAGGHEWENRYEDGTWTYRLEDVWSGLQACYRDLVEDVRERYGVPLTTIGAIGVSAMMHGYLAFDADANLLVPFRTWRNTSTGQAAAALTDLFGFNVPLRWSIAHLDQAILDGEPHVPRVRYLTTLAGYVHWQLTGQRVLGVGDASGMFPIDSSVNDYDARMVDAFDVRLQAARMPWTLREVLPRVVVAGEDAGILSETGAGRLDPTGQLRAGVPCCPPEGDAGTGMVATDSVAARTGNVSAGTSVFAMIVLEHDLVRVHPEIDMVTTPTGRPVAMVHSNNCTSDLDDWIGLFGEVAESLGVPTDRSRLFEVLYRRGLDGEPDGGGLLAYNHVSGETLVGLDEGRPLFVRTPGSRFDLANFMRAHLFSAVAALTVGLEILFQEEQVVIDQILGHGGFFKTEVVGQRVMAAAVGVPVSVMATAGEGGAWGIALLAAYRLRREPGESLETYLAERVFADANISTIAPNPSDVAGFAAFMRRYRQGLAIERAAIDALR